MLNGVGSSAVWAAKDSESHGTSCSLVVANDEWNWRRIELVTAMPAGDVGCGRPRLAFFEDVVRSPLGCVVVLARQKSLHVADVLLNLRVLMQRQLVHVEEK
mgnify:CR=1 FL=1